MKIFPTQNLQSIHPEVVIYIAETPQSLPANLYGYAQKHFDKKQNTVISLPFTESPTIIALLNENVKNEDQRWDKTRCLGHELLKVLKEEAYASAKINSITSSKTAILLTLEGMLLSNYEFTKYKTQKNNRQPLSLYVDLPKDEVDELIKVNESVTIARNLVNEPVCSLNALQFSEEILNLGNAYGFDVNILNETQIRNLKMGGLLGVNAGSKVPPTFNILTWKPENAINKKPYVFVGKGVVYDTGGYNVKTGSYMDTMKADMAGGAAVVGLLTAIAKNNLAVHVVGLIPATDNRINSNAFVSDDILTMMNGVTVEVKNTDAEGRLILADALVYAQRYDPQLVIDLATLTGAAARITGHYGSAMMGNADDAIKQQLQKSGNIMYERLVELPFWDEFNEDLKSPIADIKNLGNPEGGASSAGKFLERFTDYPWMHLDIAGSAFLNSPYKYYKAGATGFGIRLLYHFLNSQIEK